MNKLSRLLLIIGILAIVFISGCNSKTKNEDPAPPIVAKTGELFGLVNAYYVDGSSIARSGVVAELEGPDGVRTATSDNSGRYEFKDLPTGTYSLKLSFARLDFLVSPFRRFNISYTRTTQPTFIGHDTLVYRPATESLNLTLGNSNSTGFPFQFTLISRSPVEADLNFYRVAFFAGASAGVTPSNGTLLYTTTTTRLGQVTGTIPSTLFNNAGFASGQRVYLVAYGLATISPTYTEPGTGRRVYGGVGRTPSTEVMVVVP